VLIPPVKINAGAVMRKKLTATTIANLQVEEGKAYAKLFDTEVTGLGVRKTAKGVASFIFEKRPAGSSVAKQITLGRCKDWSIEQARAKARQLVVEYSSPDYVSSQALKAANPSFEQAVGLYDELVLSQRAASYRDKTLGTLRRYLVPKFGPLNVSDISRQHVLGIVTPIMQGNRNPTAQMVWEAASNLMTFAVRHGYRDDNPLIRVKPEFKKVARERVLSFEEVRAVWLATNALSEIHKAAVRLLMLLPFRKTEFLGSNWGEVQNNWINIPANRTKNTDATSLFISSFAQSQLPSRQNTSDLIFTTDGVVPTRLGSKILNKLRLEASIPHWQIHDFRRTFSTHMHEVNSAHHIIEACLNHRDGTRQGVSGVYNRAKYRDQKQMILQQWSDILEDAVG